MSYDKLMEQLHILYAEFYEMFSSFSPEDPGFICIDVAHTAFHFLFDAMERYDDVTKDINVSRKLRSSRY